MCGVLQDDWTEDAQGRTELEFKRFHMSLFQLTGACKLQRR